MKAVIVLLCVVTLACSAPQPRKHFHEHVEDLMDVIWDFLEELMEYYLEFGECFGNLMDYVRTKSFGDLLYKMKSLPEFKAVIDFLEKDNIDIHYFLDRVSDMIGSISKSKLRHNQSGEDFSTFPKDNISEFPLKKLAELFEQKKEEDKKFKTAAENLESQEWNQIFSALWESEVFQKEVQTLADNGINVHLILIQLKAIFGHK